MVKTKISLLKFLAKWQSFFGVHIDHYFVVSFVMIVVHILKDGNIMVQYTCLANIILFHFYALVTT
jgi:hypothetical protein